MNRFDLECGATADVRYSVDSVSHFRQRKQYGVDVLSDDTYGGVRCVTAMSTSDANLPRQGHSNNGLVECDPGERLMSLPCELICTIATSLPFAAFVKFLYLNKALSAVFEARSFGKGLITDMSNVTMGHQILDVIPRIMSVQRQWQSDLALSFARKVADVEIRDQHFLTDAWTHLLEHIPEIGQIDAVLIRFFAFSKNERWSLSLTRDEREPLAILWKLSDKDRYAVINRLIGEDGLSGRRYILTSLADAPDGLPTASPALAEALAFDLFTDFETQDGSGVLARRYGVSVEVQRRDIDPLLVRNVLQWNLTLAKGCERWRPGDAAFLRMAENALRDRLQPYLRMADLDHLLSEFSGEYRTRFTLQSLDLFLSLDLDAATLRGVNESASITASIAALYKQIVTVPDSLTWCALCETVRQLPWQTWPFFMYQLAVRQPFRKDQRTQLNSLFTYFRAWRDDIVQKCVSNDAMKMVARAQAAVIELWRVYLRKERGTWVCIEGDHSPTVGPLSDRHWEICKAFQSVPQRFWQPILEAAVGPRTDAYQVWDAASIVSKMTLFLRDPDATCVLPTREFDSALRRIVDSGSLFASDGEPQTALSDLCARFGWEEKDVRESILVQVYHRVRQGNQLLEEALSAVRMEDEAAFRAVGKRLWRGRILPDLRAGMDWHEAVSKYTLVESYVVDQARIYAAGTDKPH